MRLSIFDISGFLHAGASSKKNYRVSGFPLDGVIYAIRSLVTEGLCKEDTIVCFDSKTDRSTLIPTYKSGRNKTNIHEIKAQDELLYDILTESGIAATRVEGFEADDLIYSNVQAYQDKYAFLRIFTNDADIAHNVTNKVSIHPVSTQTNSINIRNYKTAIKKGEDIYLGTVTLHKLFKGDSSDKIPAFRSERGISGDQLYKDTVEIVRKYIAFNPYYATTLDFLEFVLKAFGPKLTEKDLEELRLRAKVFYPRKTEEIITPSKPKTIKGTVFLDLLHATKQYQLLNMLGFNSYSPSDDSLQKRLRTMSRMLESGAYGSTRGLSFSTSTLDYSTAEVRSF